MLLQGSLADAILLVLLFVFLLLFITIFLKIGLGFVESEKYSFGQAFLTALICAIVFFLLFWLTPNTILWYVITILIGLLISWAIINFRHKTGYGGAIAVTIVAVIFGVIITLILIWFIGIVIGAALIIL
jgi:hypothetical protein